MHLFWHLWAFRSLCSYHRKVLYGIRCTVNFLSSALSAALTKSVTNWSVWAPGFFGILLLSAWMHSKDRCYLPTWGEKKKRALKKEALGEHTSWVWVAASSGCPVSSHTCELYSCHEGGIAHLVPLNLKERESLGYLNNSEWIIMMSNCFLMKFKLKYWAGDLNYFVNYTEKGIK